MDALAAGGELDVADGGGTASRFVQTQDLDDRLALGAERAQDLDTTHGRDLPVREQRPGIAREQHGAALSGAAGGSAGDAALRVADRSAHGRSDLTG